MTEHTRKPTATDAVLAVLAAHPNATAAELAVHASVGRSTATKALADLTQTGRVRRVPGEGKPGRRAPDRWLRTDNEAEQALPGEAQPQPAKAEPASERRGATASGSKARTLAERQPQDARLGKGALAKLVLDYLQENAHGELSPTAVAKALDRSSGAVANALERLTAKGSVRKTSEKPRRYQHTAKPR
jgi:predicted transcriptional regulator